MADLTDKSPNVSIVSQDALKTVTTTTDGAKERLDVDANITGGNFQLQPFRPKLTVDTTGLTLNTSTWSTMLSVTGEGKLDFIAAVGSSSQFRIRLTVDGNIVYNVQMSDLSAVGLSNATNVPMWADTADKNFRYHPNVQIDFTTSLLIEAMATAATPNLKYLITYREPA